VEALARVLDDVLDIVTASEQDTSWVGRWTTADEMIRELRGHADRIRRGDRSALGELEFLFLPTGPLQEVSLSSGWGDLFLDVAERFDRARRDGVDGVTA
jgi:hypothetical protein